MQPLHTTPGIKTATNATMRIAYLDCFAGVSGDMFLGALLGAGLPHGVLEDAVDALGLEATLRISSVDRSGIWSTKVDVYERDAQGGERRAEAPVPHKQHDKHHHKHGPKHDHEQSHDHDPKSHSHADEPRHDHSHQHGRSLTQIRELLQNAPLPHNVRHRAIHTFELLGAAEAKIHNVSTDAIHFHEVGAVDAIVDIVAACAGIEYLASLDGESGPLAWYASPVNVGGGMVECAHGTFPVPAPATAELLRGMPTYSAHVQKELVTPTGAALLASLAPIFGPQPPMLAGSIGYGAGSRNPKGFPNVLRLTLGTRGDFATVEPLHRQAPIHGHQHSHAEEGGHAEASVTVLETALDDCTPQLLAYVAEQALAAGALDVMLSPVTMKKGRPGTLITVLCNEHDAGSLEDLLLLETPTLGVRRHRQHRSCLRRAHVHVETAYGPIRVKTGSRDGQVLNATPEFEDCRAAAQAHNAPLKLVVQAAIAAYADHAGLHPAESVTVHAH